MLDARLGVGILGDDGLVVLRRELVEDFLVICGESGLPFWLNELGVLRRRGELELFGVCDRDEIFEELSE